MWEETYYLPRHDKVRICSYKRSSRKKDKMEDAVKNVYIGRTNSRKN